MNTSSNMDLQGILVGGQFQDALPLIVMGSPAILVGVLTLWLPETSGKTLPETIEDLEIVKWYVFVETVQKENKLELWKEISRM